MNDLSKAIKRMMDSGKLDDFKLIDDQSEQCPKCKGFGYHANHAFMQSCMQCHGTGRYVSNNIVFPKWEPITIRCNNKMAQRYGKHGNSWLVASNRQLMLRIAAEFVELSEAVACKNRKDVLDEAHDMIAQLAMLITNMNDNIGDRW